MFIKKFLIGGAGLAALAAAAPSTAQYYGYGQYGYSNPYGYSQPYGYAYGYRSMNTSAAASQCTAAVQNRLYARNYGGILGALVGAYGTQGRVLSVTRVTPNNYGGVRVRGLASSGRYGYYGNTADLSFRCDVDYRGYVRNVDINRR